MGKLGHEGTSLQRTAPRAIQLVTPKGMSQGVRRLCQANIKPGTRSNTISQQLTDKPELEFGHEVCICFAKTQAGS